MNMAYFQWDEAKVARLEELLRKGYSASQIGRELGTGRNSVIGKVHRSKTLRFIGLGGRVSKEEKCSNATKRVKKAHGQAPQRIHPGNIARKKAQRPNDPGIEVSNPISSLAYEADCLRLLIHELGQRQCRWEVNSAALGEDHLFCGKQSDEGRSYCEHHRLKSIGRGTESERSASRIAVRLGRVA